MYEIEKDIPIIKSRWRESKYPFPEMEIGDSFFVPLNGKEARKVQPSIVSCGNRYRDKRFTTRIIIEEGVKIGIRCWRVEKKNKKGR